MPKRERKVVKAKKAAPAKTPRKRKSPVKSVHEEPVQNGQVVTDDAIQRRAYERWEAAGRPPGDDIRFWVEAKEELTAGK